MMPAPSRKQCRYVVWLERATGRRAAFAFTQRAVDIANPDFEPKPAEVLTPRLGRSAVRPAVGAVLEVRIERILPRAAHYAEARCVSLGWRGLLVGVRDPEERPIQAMHGTDCAVCVTGVAKHPLGVIALATPVLGAPVSAPRYRGCEVVDDVPEEALVHVGRRRPPIPWRRSAGRWAPDPAWTLEWDATLGLPLADLARWLVEQGHEIAPLSCAAVVKSDGKVHRTLTSLALRPVALTPRVRAQQALADEATRAPATLLAGDDT